MRYFYYFLFILGILNYFFIHQPAGVEILFSDVGQGDAFALRTPSNKIIIIDGGPNWNSLYGLGRWLGFGQHDIDILILTHDHDDHITALPEILQRFRVSKIILPLGLDSQSSKEFLSVIKNNELDSEVLSENRCVELEDACRLCLFPPDDNFKKSKDKNDLSIALHFDCAGLSLVAAGDAPQAREESLLKNEFDWHAQILKVSHHGSDFSSPNIFIKAVAAQLGFISVGENNSYGHPGNNALERLSKIGMKIWRSDELGSLLVYASDSQIFIRKAW
jgi:competence protein ComEC